MFIHITHSTFGHQTFTLRHFIIHILFIHHSHFAYSSLCSQNCHILRIYHSHSPTSGHLYKYTHKSDHITLKIWIVIFTSILLKDFKLCTFKIQVWSETITYRPFVSYKTRFSLALSFIIELGKKNMWLSDVTL